MKRNRASFLVLAAVGTLFAIGPALANADDVAWIKQCVADNKDEGQTPKVVEAYCTCMDDAMSSSEERSITAWEQTHKPQEEACSKKAGWKGK